MVPNDQFGQFFLFPVQFAHKLRLCTSNHTVISLLPLLKYEIAPRLRTAKWVKKGKGQTIVSFEDICP